MLINVFLFGMGAVPRIVGAAFATRLRHRGSLNTARWRNHRRIIIFHRRIKQWETMVVAAVPE